MWENIVNITTLHVGRLYFSPVFATPRSLLSTSIGCIFSDFCGHDVVNMKFKDTFYSLVVVHILLFHSVSTKTIKGVVNSYLAREDKGQYLSSFCFHGKW